MEQVLTKVFAEVGSYLNEKQIRQLCASFANAIGRGGRAMMNRVTGLNRQSINLGIKELSGDAPAATGRIRKEGGGRKPVEEKQPGIVEAILRLVDGESYGNPDNPLSWTTKSTYNISSELKELGFKANKGTVGRILEECGYSLQQNQKMLQVGEPHPDRDEQFRYINDTTKSLIAKGIPVISVDCKKKENVGDFKNPGSEYRPNKSARKVLDHDFALGELGKAAPYGIYDIGRNEGFVNVGISSDTAEFAVSSIRSWWYTMGRDRYPDAGHLAITADGGGSDGHRNRLWKVELQNFATETGLAITILHFPPGTSKWNKIEHRLFSQITRNWRGRPLDSLETIVSLIGSTKTATTVDSPGLKVSCKLDTLTYEKGIKVADEELNKVNLRKHDFHGDWNYTILPHEP